MLKKFKKLLVVLMMIISITVFVVPVHASHHSDIGNGGVDEYYYVDHGMYKTIAYATVYCPLSPYHCQSEVHGSNGYSDFSYDSGDPGCGDDTAHALASSPFYLLTDPTTYGGSYSWDCHC